MNLHPSQFLPLVGQASLSAGILILLLLMARPWLRRVFGSAWVSAFWAVVLFRLLIPGTLEVPWSLVARRPAPAAVPEQPSAWKVSVQVEPAREESKWMDLADSGRRWADHKDDRLPLLWAAGALGALAYFAVRAWRTVAMVRRAVAIDEPRFQRLLDTLPGTLGRRVDLRVTEEIPVAALVGVWRPRILLPRKWLMELDDAQLRHVLLHELGHARRWDLIRQWLFVLAQCVHWFNPLVWLAARGARTDAELACDAWVLARISEQEHESYGETLLKTSQLFRVPFSMSPIAIGMAASRQMLAVRVRQVGGYRPIPRWCRLMGLAFAMSALAILMTRHVTAQAPDPSPTAAAPAAPEPVPAPGSTTVAPEAAAPSSATPAAPAVPKQVGKAARKPMVEIESRFVEVSEALGRKLGLERTPGDAVSTIGGSANRSEKSAPPPVTLNGILDAGVFGDLLKKFQETKGVDLLSAPRVTLQSGQHARVEIIREFRYPTGFEREKERGIFIPTDFETRNLGVIMDVDATVEDGLIDLTLTPEVVELEGYVRANDARPVPLREGRSVGANLSIQAFAGVVFPKDTILQPIFSTRKVTTKVSMDPGTTILLGGMRRDDRVTGQPPTSRILYVLVTARLLAPQTVTVTGQTVDDSRAAEKPAA